MEIIRHYYLAEAFIASQPDAIFVQDGKLLYEFLAFCRRPLKAINIDRPPCHDPLILARQAMSRIPAAQAFVLSYGGDPAHCAP